MPKNKSTGIVSLFLVLILYFAVYQFLNAAISGANQISNPPKAVAATNPYVTSQGTKLYLMGQKYQFTGFDAYELATYWGGDGSCGAYLSNQQITDFFSSLKPYSMVRMWAFQGSMGVDINTHQINWTYLDRVVNIASQYNIKLVLTLSDQAGTCDDQHWHDVAWYNGGYMTDYPNSQGTTPLSYWQYIQQIVAHYANNPTIAMWEPVNEPEASDCSNPSNGSACEGTQTCTNEAQSAQALLSFFNNVGAEIKNIDHNHLISSGLIGSGQCGAQGSDYQTVNDSQYIDVASYHGDQWNGLQVRINQMAAINKPLMVGETGILASPSGSGCDNLTQRVTQFQAKLTAMFNAGIVGFMPWDYTPGPTTTCSYDVNPSDPLFNLMSNNAFVYVPPVNTTQSTSNTNSNVTSISKTNSTTNTKSNSSNTINSNTNQTTKNGIVSSTDSSNTPTNTSGSAYSDSNPTQDKSIQLKKPTTTNKYEKEVTILSSISVMTLLVAAAAMVKHTFVLIEAHKVIALMQTKLTFIRFKPPTHFR